MHTLTHLDTKQEEGNTKTSSRARGYIMTWNNYNSSDIDTLTQYFRLNQAKYCIGEEIAPSTKTPHLQIFVYFPNAHAFTTMKRVFPRCHIEKMRGSIEQNMSYCTKDGVYHSNIKKKSPLKVLTENDLYDWQRDIEMLILTEPDERTIHWYWDSTGCSGKTKLTKYLLNKYDWVAFSTCTKSADILTIASEDKTAYILNFTRSQEGFAPWQALESLKDGLVSDCKLKKQSRQIVMNCPHVICFANWEPDRSKLSKDRWCIVEINPSDNGFDVI